MASFRIGWGTTLLVFAIVLVVLPSGASAFGAGNIPSIAQVEGHNWRHGDIDIEDVLETLAFLHGKKWTSMMISRTYFGNWLRDYSQAVDVGSLKGVNAATIRILVWVLSFLAHGYATEEFEVTEERLGVYRPEEHIDNPLGYADGLDARKFDPRLRGPVQPQETQIDMHTGMKNYIANEQGGWATSAGYLRFSFARSIHFGRVYTSGGHASGKEADLCEALRCLGQALHCMEDFSAHSNYCELALRELGHHSVFPHCGTSTEINIRGKRVYPLVTGTFGAVDFLHSVLGEATDHFTQSEVDEMNIALKNAEQLSKSGGGGLNAPGQRGLFGLGGSSGGGDFIHLIGQLPSIGGGFASQARDLKAASAAQEQRNAQAQQTSRANPNMVPGMSPDFDPVKVAKQIYPILEFRDKIVKSINNMISKVPGLEKLLDKISETLTAFVLGLLAPFVRPIIEQVSKVLKDGSSTVINSSANSQLEPWKNPSCSDPTHSMLSKDHFTNILNSVAGRVAATIVQYVVPRVIYAWENPGVPVDQIVNDVLRAFHHPALRDENVQIQRDMFATVRTWAQESRVPIDQLLSSDSVRNGKNHILKTGDKSSGGGGGGSHAGHNHGTFGAFQDAVAGLGHGKVKGSLWSQIQTRDLSAMGGGDGSAQEGYMSSSPAPRPTSGSGFGYQGAAAALPTHGQAASYYSGATPSQPPQPPVPEPGYGGGGYGYGGQQQPPPPGPYGGGQWGGQGGPPPPGPPPPGYGGPGGYGQGPPPPFPPYGGQPPPQQGPGWNQNPGGYPGGNHRW
ncbi:heterokaryon incompatibility Het-C [Coniochaeta ligniaria NRRL 30616]|uniref:Heterokaryon incompatibility Het-C n=1 Tax=Coniochaeta ligniaria NRRL 30616 TaxID=1408157 RepID=A0A1J7JJW9_9PEZI|nr:heterokaryon incompatibility Het-C [Coniochaeta ligniaria NRRL 30616]